MENNKENNQYKISVVMSVYKNDLAKNFKIAVDSILQQTYKPSEIVLIIDGPVPEDTEKLLSVYEKDKMFNVIRFEQNKGLGTALQVGVENAKYPIIARMDSDDISYPERFEKQINYLKEHPEVDAVGTYGIEFLDEPENTFAIKEVPITDQEIKQYMKKRNPFNHMTMTMKKDKVMQSGNYQDWYYAEDYYMWLRLYLNGANFYNIPEVLAKIRINEDTFGRRHGMKYFKSIKNLFKFMRKNKIIGFFSYVKNIFIRFAGHVLIPRKMKKKMYSKFLRNKVKEK